MTVGYIYAVCRGDDYSNVKAGYTRAPDPIKYCESNYKRVFHPLNIIKTSQVANAKLAESMLFEILKPHRKDVKHEIFGLNRAILDVAFERVLAFFDANEDANTDMIVKDLVAGIIERVLDRTSWKHKAPSTCNHDTLSRINAWLVSKVKHHTLPSIMLSQTLTDAINASTQGRPMSSKMMSKVLCDNFATEMSGILYVKNIRVDRQKGNGYTFELGGLRRTLRERKML